MRPGQAKGPSVGPATGGSGGSGITGTLTSGTVPIASGAHTLADSFLTYAANLFTSAKAWLFQQPVTFGLYTIITPAALTSVSNAVALDADLADLFTLTLTENTTIAAPTNPRTGRRFMLRIRQDGTGGRTCAFNAAFRFVSNVAPTIGANTAEVTYLGFVWNETDSKWDAVGGPTQPFQP